MKLSGPANFWFCVLVLTSLAIIPGCDADKDPNATTKTGSSVTEDVNLGRHPAGAVVSHVLALHNFTGSSWKVRDVKASCGCTVVGEYERDIQPGKELRLPITIHIPHGSEEFTSTVLIALEGQPPMVRNIHGLVDDPIVRSVDFGAIKVGGVSSRRVTLPLYRFPSPKVVECDDTLVQYRLESKTNGDHWLHLSTLPTGWAGRFSRRLLISTGDTNAPFWAFELTGYLLRQVEPVVDNIAVGASEFDAPEAGRVQLVSQDGKSLKVDLPLAPVENVDFLDPRYSINNSSVEIPFRVRGASRDEVVHRTVVVSVMLDDGSRQAVPVHIYIAGFAEASPPPAPEVVP